MVDPSTSPFVPSSSSYQRLHAQVLYAKAKFHLSHMHLGMSVSIFSKNILFFVMATFAIISHLVSSNVKVRSFILISYLFSNNCPKLNMLLFTVGI